MSVARTARLIEATKPEPFAADAARLGTELADVLREQEPASPHSYAAGYLTGVLNDIALRCPEARKIIEFHLSAQRLKALVVAA